jgi:hypothetical protein
MVCSSGGSQTHQGVKRDATAGRMGAGKTLRAEREGNVFREYREDRETWGEITVERRADIPPLVKATARARAPSQHTDMPRKTRPRTRHHADQGYLLRSMGTLRGSIMSAGSAAVVEWPAARGCTKEVGQKGVSCGGKERGGPRGEQWKQDRVRRGSAPKGRMDDTFVM